jgi:large subunit ribosomal protein L31
MKENIQPNYHDVTVKCSCGNEFVMGSTIAGDTMRVEVCSKCHPFYSGKQKQVNAGGRIDKFNARFNKAQNK